MGAVFRILPQVPWVYYTYSCQEPNVNLGFWLRELVSHLHQHHQLCLTAPVRIVNKLKADVLSRYHTVDFVTVLVEAAKKLRAAV